MKTGTERMGAISHLPELLKVCEGCGREFWGRKDKGYKFCRDCGTKVGSELVISGAVYVRLPKDDPYISMCPKKVGFLTTGDWARRSRYILAKELGRCLGEREQVWHKSKDKQDDKPKNLELKVLKEKTEEQARRTRDYKFGFDEGYEAGFEAGCKEATGTEEPKRRDETLQEQITRRIEQQRKKRSSRD